MAGRHSIKFRSFHETPRKYRIVAAILKKLFEQSIIKNEIQFQLTKQGLDRGAWRAGRRARGGAARALAPYITGARSICHCQAVNMIGAGSRHNWRAVKRARAG